MESAETVVSDAAKAAQTDQAAATGGTQATGVVEVPEYLAGTVTPEQYAKWAPEQRDWAKELYGDYTRKNQEVSELRKVQAKLDADPELTHALKQVIDNPELAKAIQDGKWSGKPTATEQATKDELDEALEDATPKQRQLIQSLIERAAKQASSVNQAKIAELEQTLKALVSDTATSRRNELDAALSKLDGERIKALAEKHRERLMRVGQLRDYRDLSVRKLLQIVAGDTEYDQAVIADAPDAAKKQVEKVVKSATGKPQATVGTSETAEPSRGVSRDARFKKGPIDVGSLLRSVHESVKRGMGV